MKICHSLDVIQKLNRVFVTFGKFETLHKGHVITLKKLVIESKKKKSKSVILCFKKSNFFSQEIKNHILKKIGIDFLVYLNLDNFKLMTFVQFLQFLTKKINLVGIVGSDKMSIGYQKRGNSLQIQKYCRNHFSSLTVKYISSTKQKFKNISSSDIYCLLKKNSFEEANQILTIPFTVKQKVISGKKIGRTINYSTINLTYPKKLFKIPYGVYATFVFYRRKIYHAMSFWGSSFNDNREKLETHLFDFNDNIYDEYIFLFFVKKFREKVPIKNLNHLKEILSQDKKKSKEILINYLYLKRRIQKFFP